MESYVKNGDTIAYDETMIAYQLMPQDFSRFVGQLVLMDDDAVGAEEPSWLEAVELERKQLPEYSCKQDYFTKVMTNDISVFIYVS